MFTIFSAPPIPMSSTASAEMEQVYYYVRAENKKKEMTTLNRNDIELLDTLGSGNFGSVCRGKYKYTKNRMTKEVLVAVKVLKCGDSPTAEVYIIILCKMRHKSCTKIKYIQIKQLR